MKKFMFLTVVLFLESTIIFGQKIEDKPTLDGTKSQSVAALSIAKSNALLGYEKQNAMFLVAAAQILLDIPLSDIDLMSAKESNQPSTQPKSTDAISLSLPLLLADAELFAAGNEPLLSLINNMKAQISSTSRGTIGGPYHIERIVDKKDQNVYEMRFIASQLAEILVMGDGDTDLDLYIFDSNNNLVESDTDYTDFCYVSWVPAWTGPYTVVIVNRGGVHNKFTMITN